MPATAGFLTVSITPIAYHHSTVEGMRVLLALVAVMGCHDDNRCCDTTDCRCLGDAAPDVPNAPPSNPLDGIGSVELIQSGFMFTEGPQWAGDKLLFSDIPANTIYQYANGAVGVFKMPSGNSNGLAFTGNLYAAEHGTRSVTRDGVAIASMFEGKKLNSPNDLIALIDLVTWDTSVYFTDPPYGIAANQQELAFNGVFELEGTTLTAIYRGSTSERPNGIGVSPSQTTLYVDDTEDGGLYTIDISSKQRAKLAMTAGGADGLAVDGYGNIFVTSNAGIEVFSPAGMKWGTITVPKKPSNCAFGDTDYQTLYITAQDSLYKVRLANPGLPY
jgi:gluconolactonase